MQIYKAFFLNRFAIYSITICQLVSMTMDCDAKNVYVSYIKGSSKYNGLSIARPKKLIQDGANIAKPGDSVLIMDGIYTNNCPTCNVVDIRKSGKADKYITFINFPNHHPVINFDGWAGIAIQNGASYIKIIGLEIVGNRAKINLRDAINQPQGCARKKGTIDAKFNGNGIAIGDNSKKHSHHII